MSLRSHRTRSIAVSLDHDSLVVQQKTALRALRRQHRTWSESLAAAFLTMRRKMLDETDS